MKPEEKEERPRYWGEHAVEKGKLIYVSPSQIKTFQLCAMKWYQEKVMGRAKKPAGKGAKLGGECHKRTEVYLLTGSDVRGPIEQVGAANLGKYVWAAPFMGGPGEVEGALIDPIISTAAGVLISGFVDYKIPGRAPSMSEHEREPHILDHKFRKDIARYAETAEELQDDPQAILYGAHALAKDTAATGVMFTHLNVQTEGTRYAQEVPTHFTRDQVFAKFAALGAFVDSTMAPVAAMPSIDTVPHAGTDACRAFGGCDFINVCPKSPAARARESWLRGGIPEVTTNTRFKPKYESVNTMGLIGQSKAAAPAVVPPAPAPAKRTAPASGCVGDKVYLIPDGKGGRVMGKFEAQVGTRSLFRLEDKKLTMCESTDEVEDLSGTVAESIFNGTNGKPAPLAHPKPQIVDAPPTPAPIVATPSVTVLTPVIPPAQVAALVPPGEGVSTDPSATATPAAAAIAVANAVAPAIPPESATAAAGEVKAKRGRKPKAAGDVAEAADTEDESGLFLLVDCSSSKPTVDLAPYVAGLAAEICKREGIADLRLAPKTSDASYSGWKGLLAIEAMKNPPTGLCSVSRTELSEPVIEALAAIAKVVVRGSR